jgi:hypothetical protein
VGTTGPRAHSSTAESSALASDGGHGGRLRRPLLVDLWGSGGRVPATLSLGAPLLQLSSDAVSAATECDHLVSEVRTWLVREVTLSALWSGAPCLTYMAAAAAHSGAAPPDSVCPLRSGCPSEAVPVYLALLALCPTPSPASSSSSYARQPPYPSAYRLPSVREKGRRL